MKSIIFYFSGDTEASFIVDDKTAAAIDENLHYKMSTQIYFIRFTDNEGAQQRINLAKVTQVTIDNYPDIPVENPGVFAP